MSEYQPAPWRLVNDELPTRGDRVLVWYECCGYPLVCVFLHRVNLTAEFGGGTEYAWLPEGASAIISGQIKYWMPLPRTPYYRRDGLPPETI